MLPLLLGALPLHSSPLPTNPQPLTLPSAHPQGSISARDFAHSVVSCARLKHVDQYLDKVEVRWRYEVPLTCCWWPLVWLAWWGCV